MITLLTILLVLACAIIAFFVLIQQPKGGGLAGNFGSLSTQMMGVKQSADVMEKGTWATMAAIGLICIFSVAFIVTNRKADDNAGGTKKEQKSGGAAGTNQNAGADQAGSKPPAK